MEIKNKLKYNKNLFVYHYFIYIQIFHNAYTLTINNNKFSITVLISNCKIIKYCKIFLRIIRSHFIVLKKNKENLLHTNIIS